METYTVSKNEDGLWIITKEFTRRGWMGVPCRIGDPKKTRKSALTVARILAGREDRVKVLQ